MTMEQRLLDLLDRDCPGLRLRRNQLDMAGVVDHPHFHVVARGPHRRCIAFGISRSEEHTSELQSLMRISYAVFCLKKKNSHPPMRTTNHNSETNKLNINHQD